MRPVEPTHGLTAEQRAQYDAEGFLLLPGYLDAETVAALTDAAEAILERVGPWVPENPRVQVDPSGDQAECVGAPPGPLPVGIRQVWPVIDLSETVARFAADERILGLFRSLFDGDRPVLFEDKLNYKHPHVGTHFPMHQDYSYWQPYSPRLTSAMIYLDAAAPENGCLEVVPGGHRQGLLPRSEMKVGTVTDHYLPPETVDPSLAVPVPGPPGTVILFSCLTPHRSSPNRTERPRRALILTYNPAADGDFYAETSGAGAARANAWLAEEGRRTSQ